MSSLFPRIPLYILVGGNGDGDGRTGTGTGIPCLIINSSSSVWTSLRRSVDDETE